MVPFFRMLSDKIMSKFKVMKWWSSGEETWICMLNTTSVMNCTYSWKSVTPTIFRCLTCTLGLQVDSRSSFRSSGGWGGPFGSGPKPHQQPTTAADAGAGGRGEEPALCVCVHEHISCFWLALTAHFHWAAVELKVNGSSSSVPSMSMPLKLILLWKEIKRVNK